MVLKNLRDIETMPTTWSYFSFIFITIHIGISFTYKKYLETKCFEMYYVKN